MTDTQKRDRVLKQALECRVQLTAYAQALLGNYLSADDVIQEAMLVVVKKYEQFEEGTSMLAWCRSIVRLEVLRSRQKHQRERTLAERLLEDSIDGAFEEFQNERRKEGIQSWHDALGGCLEKLNSNGRRVLNARFVDGLGYQQIAEKIGIQLEAVRKTLYRSKRQLRNCVEIKMRGES